MTLTPLNAGKRLTAATLALLPRGIVGGREITGTNNLGAAITTTETMPTNMNSGSVTLEALRRYKITATYKMIGSVATDVFVIRIREGTTADASGNQIRQQPRTPLVASSGFTWQLNAWYETGATAVSRIFTLTAVRASGTGNVQFTGGDTGSTNPVGVMVEDVGPSGLITVTAS